MAWDVLALGESMIRLTPPNNERLEQATTLGITIGGAEMNTAIAVARLGLRAAWLSKLTNNALGRLIAGHARFHGVDTSPVIWTDHHRVGVYFFEEGSTPRPSEVLYDRANTAVSTLDPEEVDWPTLLAGVRVFHTSGITPALSDSCRRATERSTATARQLGCLTSFDLNYRGKLWSPKEARAALARILPNIDLFLGSPETIQLIFGFTGDPEMIAHRVWREFGCRIVAFTVREGETTRASRVSSVVYANDGANRVIRGVWRDVEIIDRLGGGDAYTAGFLYGYLTGAGDLERAVAYADAMAALKHTIRGDFAVVTLAEVEAQIAGGGRSLNR